MSTKNRVKNLSIKVDILVDLVLKYKLKIFVAFSSTLNSEDKYRIALNSNGAIINFEPLSEGT